jgi:adenosine kinase
MKHPCLYEVDGTATEDALAIIAPGNTDDMLTYSRVYQQKRIPYIFDPGQQVPVLSAENMVEMIGGSKMFISNDYELEMVMRATGLQKSDILQRTPAIITTLGDRGAVLCTREGEETIAPAMPREVKDPTGAGDAFRAGLIKGLVMGKDLVESALMGAVCASFGVECQGTQCHRFSEEDFWERHGACFGGRCTC